MSNDLRLQLKKFDLSKIADEATIALIAKRNSGKSWVTRDILWHKRHIPGGIIICPTDKNTKFYEDFFPPLFIHYEYKSEILTNAMMRQDQILEKMEQKKDKKIVPHALIVMDDCLADKHIWRKDPNLGIIFMNGRHKKLMFILTLQDPMGIQPMYRNNLDYVFLLRNPLIVEQKKIWLHYAGMFETFEMFQKAFIKCTENFGCMVIDNLSRSDNLQDRVFYFKAEPRTKFEFGCRQFRQFSALNYDPKYDKRPKVFNINDITKKNGCHIIVDKE